MKPQRTIQIGGFSPLGLLAEKIGKEAVRNAKAEHKANGNPIYYSNDNGQMIKEFADGRKFLVNINLDGTQKLGKQIN